MKNRYSIPAALLLLLAPGCEDKSSTTANQLEELERKTNEALDRQQELEKQLEDQKLAAEREAIERERLLIEEDRLELERQQGEAAAAEAEALRQREEALVNREGKLQQVQSDLEKKEAILTDRGVELNARDRELAGREAIPFEVTESTVPVADYGMFYDSLSSYGSWFETPDYGYVWQPAVITDSNWRPYSRGRWVCSDRGWTWVSEEPFGWATYHYGRWALIRGRGWVWVPGTEWAPCWVSWRESGSHIGWAPLPPETMAYRNHRWDSTVDDQFGISSAWFNFVEIHHFGSPLYQYCLPVSRNALFIQGTVNITYIHLVNRQVICGGPQYEKINRRLGRPIPFYRLELEDRSRQSRETLGMRPRIKGERMMVSAPNMDAAWNDGLRPARVKGSIDTRAVERKEPLRAEITDRFKKNREEGQRIARRSMDELGGSENFKQNRVERLEENRKQVENRAEKPVKEREPVKVPDRPQRDETKREQPGRLERPSENRVADRTVPGKSQDADAPAVTPPADERPPRQEFQGPRPEVGKPSDPSPPRPQELREQPRQLDRDARVKPQDALKQPRSTRIEDSQKKAAELKNQDAVPQVRKPQETRPREPEESGRKAEDAPRGLQMEALLKHREQQEKQRQQQETQRQAQQAAEAREAARQNQVEQAQQIQRQAQQAREQVLEKQRQREEALAAGRQKQVEQQQEMQRQQERARQEQEQEQQRQEEAGRQQQRNRERQQEESQRQQQQERERQQEQSRQREQEQSRQREQEQNQRQQEKAREAESEKGRVRDSERSRNR